MTITKELKIIKENTAYIDAKNLIKIDLTSTKQIACRYKIDNLTWTGEIQKIYLDKNGEAIGYDVYTY